MAGTAKQIKGKINDVVGAARGDIGQQLKGKVQKVVGKAQHEMAKSDRQSRRQNHRQARRNDAGLI